MSHTAIRVENLSKKYLLRHQNETHRYTALRDVIAGGVRSLGRRALQPFGNRSDVPSQEEFWALKDVCFEVAPGEAVGIIGRNGAGKSTLLKLLSRITEPTTGRIAVRGRVASLLEVGTGFHPELTGRENIYLNGAILGMHRAEIKRKFEEIVAFAEVEKFLDTPVKRYSSGMYVRLAFAVAAHLEPEILVVDEVLAVGDAAFQRKCLGKMGNAASQDGRTVLFVSHNMAAVQNLCPRALLLNRGQLCLADSTDKVVREYLKTTLEQTEISLAERADRKGSGEARFLAVTLLDAEREPVGSFRTGEPAILAVTLENRRGRPLQNVRVVVGIDDQYGQRITMLDTDLTGQEFAQLSGPTSGIEIHIDRLPLMPGGYGMALYCAVSGVMADWIQAAGTFNVESGDFYGTGKLPTDVQIDFVLNHRFEVAEIAHKKDGQEAAL